MLMRSLLPAMLGLLLASLPLLLARPMLSSSTTSTTHSASRALLADLPACETYLDVTPTPTTCPLGYQSPPLTILTSNTTTVTFTTSQLWKTTNLSWIAVDYPTGDSDTCTKTEQVHPGAASDPFVATCTNGYALVTVYIHDGSISNPIDITPTIPRRCSPSKDKAKKCALQFLLSCQRCSPPVASCSLDTQAKDTTPNTTVCSFSYSSPPVSIVAANCSTVNFTVSQTWKQQGTMSWVAVLFPSTDGALSCPKTNNVAYATATTGTLTAQCTDGYADVTVYIHDGNIVAPDITDSIPAICEPSQDKAKKCASTFRLPCSCCPV